MKAFWAAVFAVALHAGPAREIVGRVVDSQTGAPVARARVTVLFYMPNGQQSTVPLLTDEGGVFDLKNAPEGSVQTNIQRTGYLPANVNAGAKSPLVVRLVPQAVIDGTVIDEKGAPVRSANVQAYVENIVEGHRQPQVRAAGQTDDTGAFRFFGLTAGRYRVGTIVPPNGMQAPKTAYRPVFYPNSPDLQGAELLDLHAGQERHLQIKLGAPVPARQISGTVAPTGDGVGIQLRPADSLDQMMTVMSRWDSKTKSFQMGGVPAGSYVLEAMTSLGDKQFMASMPLVVGERDITGLRIEPRQQAEITGVLKFTGVDKVAPGFLRVEFRSKRGRFSAQMDADGKFRFPGLPQDRYRLLVTAESPVYLRSAWQDGRELVDSEFELSSAASDLELEMTGPAAQLQLSLPEPAQDPPETLLVMLLRRAGEEMVPVKEQYVNRAVPRHLTMQGIPPGDYTLYCWGTDAQIAYADTDFFERYGALGKAVSLKTGENTEVKIENIVRPMD